MPRQVATLVAVLLILAVSPAQAKHEAIPQFHPLTQGFTKRLEPAARKNVDAVIRYGAGQATGVVVKNLPGRRALLLTNRHAHEYNPTADLIFSGGQVGRVLRHVASDSDYAMLEIAVPPGVEVEAAEMTGKRLKGGARVYSVSASTNPLATGRRLRETTARADKRSVRRMAKAGAMRTLQGGFEIGGGKTYPMPIEGQDSTLDSLVFHMPNAPGMSGSPIFGRKSHRLVALHWGGDDELQQSVGLPTRAILQNLALKLRTDEIPKDLRRPLKSLLDETAGH